MARRSISRAYSVEVFRYGGDSCPGSTADGSPSPFHQFSPPAQDPPPTPGRGGAILARMTGVTRQKGEAPHGKDGRCRRGTALRQSWVAPGKSGWIRRSPSSGVAPAVPAGYGDLQTRPTSPTCPLYTSDAADDLTRVGFMGAGE